VILGFREPLEFRPSYGFGPRPEFVPSTLTQEQLEPALPCLPSYDDFWQENTHSGEWKNMKNLFRDFDWGALQAFVAVVALPVMIIFGGFTILLWNN
jgi:hypothetical protein